MVIYISVMTQNHLIYDNFETQDLKITHLEDKDEKYRKEEKNFNRFF